MIGSCKADGQACDGESLICRHRQDMPPYPPKNNECLNFRKKESSIKMSMPEPAEYSHIEVVVVRNKAWLEQFEKRGFFLSPEMAVEDFELPVDLKNMNEADLEQLRVRIAANIGLREKKWDDEK